MTGAAQYNVTFVPPTRGSDGRILIQRDGSTEVWSRTATPEHLVEARIYCELARVMGFGVNDLALAKAQTALAKGAK
jgi:tryptophan synthase alpha subunit